WCGGLSKFFHEGTSDRIENDIGTVRFRDALDFFRQILLVRDDHVLSAALQQLVALACSPCRRDGDGTGVVYQFHSRITDTAAGGRDQNKVAGLDSRVFN